MNIDKLTEHILEITNNSDYGWIDLDSSDAERIRVTLTKALSIANVSTRTWYFQGGAGKDSFRIPITATDRETAISMFETNYPDKKWSMDTCYD